MEVSRHLVVCLVNQIDSEPSAHNYGIHRRGVKLCLPCCVKVRYAAP